MKSKQPAASSQQPAASSQSDPTELKSAIEKLYQWQYGVRDPNDFTFQFFTLLQMASAAEFAKLESAYPAEAKAYRLWYQSPDPVGFFESHGVWKGPRSK